MWGKLTYFRGCWATGSSLDPPFFAKPKYTICSISSETLCFVLATDSSLFYPKNSSSLYIYIYIYIYIEVHM